ncbi:MAG: hypothetical protein KatS3mg124_1510 [Porticoccaceae bacterium]|nr:MAG: hypothetical protein KatS3mg124_1510 [Porticoccaceae bacterium]
MRPPQKKTTRTRRGALLLAALSALAGAPASAAGDLQALLKPLSRAAPGLSREVLAKALTAADCAVAQGIPRPARLAVIDYSLPSDRRRLWLFDLEKRRLLLHERVAHGRNSGDRWVERVSNEPGSLQTSVGLFRAAEPYRGRHGYALRLDGLEPGINDRARERAIVIHGAPYVDPAWIARYGRIGRSHGCPAVAQGVVRQVVDALAGGQLVFSYYPDPAWLGASPFLHCRERMAALHRSREG